MNKNKVWNIVYWIATVWLTFGYIFGGIDELRHGAASVALITGLGYPLYLLNILGTAKLLAVVGIWQKKWPTLREWAYAGITFNLVGAIASHILHGDGIKGFGPALGMLIVMTLSYIGLKRRFQ